MKEKIVLKPDEVKRFFVETLDHVSRSEGYAVAHAHRDALCDLLEAVAVQAVYEYEGGRLKKLTPRTGLLKKLIAELRQT